MRHLQSSDDATEQVVSVDGGRRWSPSSAPTWTSCPPTPDALTLLARQAPAANVNLQVRRRDIDGVPCGRMRRGKRWLNSTSPKKGWRAGTRYRAESPTNSAKPCRSQHDPVKRRNENEPRLAVPSCHGRLMIAKHPYLI